MYIFVLSAAYCRMTTSSILLLLTFDTKSHTECGSISQRWSGLSWLRRRMILVLFRFICYARGLHLPPCQWNRRGVASRSTAIPALAIGLHWSCINSIQFQSSNQHPFQNWSLYTTFRAVIDLEQTWYLQIFTFTIVIYKVVRCSPNKYKGRSNELS